MVTAAFFPYGLALAPEQHSGGCSPAARPLFNYAFLHPDIVDKKASYAPFFVRWSDYYADIYFKVDIQKRDNLAEWKERFCNKAIDADVEYVVYKASSMDLHDMRSIIGLPYPSRNLPRSLMGNTFAEILVENGCHEAIDYLLYARDCEPHVVHQGDGWTLPSRDTAAMQTLIHKGRMQFDQCTSHFLKMRYAYQMVRLAHYAGRWQQTVSLYRELMPRIDRRKPSIVYFWALGHQAGALRKLGQYAEAAYRYALIFKHCPSKRVSAFNSFHIRSDADWNEAIRLCQNDSEKATLLILRSGVAQSYTVGNLRTLYALDPAHPQLELLLLSAVHDMERIFLRTAVTDLKYGVNPDRPRERSAVQQLLDLQKFTRDGLQEGKVLNPKLWAGLLGYLELLAGDVYDAEKRFIALRRSLSPRDAYEKALINQIETWEVVRAILALEAQSPYLDDQAFRIQGYEAYKRDPMLQRFLLDVLSARYAEGGHPGKALVTAFGPKFLGYNPQMDVLDDLIRVSAQTDPVFLEKAFKIDTNPDQIRAMLIEMKGVHLFSIGKTEAAVVTMRGIPDAQRERLPRFKPFKEVTDERIHRPVPDSLLLTRPEIFERILEYDLRARGAEAVQDPVAALYYYLNGLAHYNMSYFGYEWQATDYFRSGANWERLPKGPVFSAYGSPAGNRENIDIGRALYYFEKAYQTAQNRELAARAAFMAARCHQKQWFCSKTCTYRPGSKTIPELPNAYLGYYRLLHKHFSDTEFYGEMIRECKWLKYYH
jgi:hypothetical protein